MKKTPEPYFFHSRRAEKTGGGLFHHGKQKRFASRLASLLPLFLLYFLLGSYSWASIDPSPADTITRLVHDSSSIENKIPLILIHGIHGTKDILLNSTPEYFANLLQFIHDTGLDNLFKVYRFHYESDQQSVEEIARALRNKIDDQTVSGVFPDKQFVIIAHSMGGLVARSYMEQRFHLTGSAYVNKRGGERVIKLITLGTPHHGSPLASKRPRFDSFVDPKWAETSIAADLVYWGLFTKCFLPCAVDPGHFNRSDLRWDNYNNMWGSDYENDPGERNDWLRQLNESSKYDDRINAYNGYIGSDPQVELYGPLDASEFDFYAFANKDLLQSDYHVALRFLGVLLARTFKSDNNDNFLETFFQPYTRVDYLDNDGEVPSESAYFANHTVAKVVACKGHDHLDMKDGGVGYCGNGLTLFINIEEDLESIYTAFSDVSPPIVTLTAPTAASTVSGFTPVLATAKDNVRVFSVEFQLNGIPQRRVSVSPYNWTWDTTLLPNGLYTLLAKAYDAAGNEGTSQSVTVTVNNGGDTIPPVISTVRAVTTLTTATITWLTNEPANSQVEYGLSPCPCGSTSPLDLALATNHSITLTGLSPSTTYNYRVRSRDLAGNLAVSANNTFRTGAGNSAPSVVLGKPNGGENWPVGSLQTITWNAFDDVAVIAVSLFYTTDALNWNPIAINISNTGSFAWTVPNAPSSTVRLSILAFDATSASGWDSSDGNFTISSVCALPAAPSLNSISVTAGSYTVGWSSVSGATSYILEEDVTSSFTNPLRYSVSSATLSRFFSGKAAGTYYYRIRTVNNCGEGGASGIQSATVVLNQGPGPITAVSPADNATNQPLSLDLCWSASHPGGESLRFNVYVTPSDTEFFFPNNIKSSGQTGTCYSATNLPYNTRVSWGIEAIDGTGDARFSSMFHFTTIADTSAPTGGIVINNGALTTTSYTVTLNLSASDAGSGVQFMRFSNNGIDWSNWQFFASQTSWNISDPAFGGRFGLTTYTVYARFKDNQGNESIFYNDSIDKVAGTPGNIILNGKFYETIQDAINVANPGDTVFLTEGYYVIQGAASPLRPHDPNRNVGVVLRPGVRLMGAGAAKTTIEFQGSFYGLVDGDNTVVEGVTLINSSTFTSRAVVLLESSSSTIKNGTIRGGYYGIYVGYSANKPGTNAQILNNVITGNEFAVWLSPDAPNATLYNNTIANNTGTSCVVNTYLSSTTIRNNIIALNYCGIQVNGAVTPTISHNDVFNTQSNYGGISNQTGTNGNISADPLFVNAAGGNYSLNSGSPAINAGTNVGIPFAGSAPDIGAFEFNATGTLQVTSNQPSATFTVVGPQATYNGSGTNWSVANVPLGVYTITFAPIANLYSPPYQAKTLLSGQTLAFDGTYAQDLIPPTGNMTVNYGEYATGNSLVTITFDLSDEVAGLGAGASMKFSNDGENWSPAEPYWTIKKNWDLTSFGGSATAGLKTVFAQVSDSLGNWSTLSDTILYVPNRETLEVPSQYSTIQAAINLTQPGDIVHVAPGNYSENLILRDGVTLQGSGPDKTRFIGGGQGIPNLQMAPNAKVEGFGGFWRVQVTTGPAIIANNEFELSGVIVSVDRTKGLFVRNNLFKGNSTGISLDREASVTVENNTFVNVAGAAMQVNNAVPETRLYNRNNIFAYNNIAVLDLISNDQGHQHVFSSFNTYWNNTKGSFGELDPFYQTANMYKTMEGGDVNADPLFVNRTGGDFHLLPGSFSIDSGHPEARYNDPDGSRNDRGAYGGPSLNTPPVADFTITPDIGNVGTFFIFDASTSFDKETSDSKLLVRWDFDSDGIWDTDYSPLKIVSEQFTTLGTFDVKLEVRDENGFIAIITKQVTVNNQGPNIPRNPSPADGSTNQPIAVNLSWSGGDPDPTDSVSYDVYYGTTGDPPLVSSDQPVVTYSPPSSNHHTFYYWRVVAKDNHGNSTSGPVWTFLTAPADTTPPDTSITDGPTGTINVNSASFTWIGSDNTTQTGNLLYAYRLDPLEASFSAFGSGTSQNYPQLANGNYTFYVKARDEAGNEDPVPANQSFTVNVPPLHLTAPNGGEVWKIGSTQTIQWTSTITGNVKILLSRNGGAKWAVLSKSTANDGNQSWKVTKGTTTKARIQICRIKAPFHCDTSDANFTIQP
jgi:pimeloyl-ACP methyl ester carboxylesterase